MSRTADDTHANSDVVARQATSRLPGAANQAAGPIAGAPLADCLADCLPNVNSPSHPAVWLEHAEELRRFVLGVTRDADLTADVLQNTFAKAVEQAGSVAAGSFKAWLFKVAYNEAMLHHRRKATGEKVIRRVAWEVEGALGPVTPEAVLARREVIDSVRTALQGLPASQQDVVRRRMYEQQKFVDIAEELGLPLGTVLSRMQLALKKLRAALAAHDS